MLLPGPFECAACGAAPVWTQRAGGLAFARCDRCHHAAVAVEDLPRATLDYGHDYAGFRPDPLFSSFVRGFLRDEVVPRVGASGRVLDLGCGNGEFLSGLAEAGLRGLGWDVSEPAVAMVRERGLDAVVGPLDEVVPAGAFDLVTMWDVIEHVPAPRQLLRSALRALRPGGWILVKTPGVTAPLVELCARVPRLGASLLSIPAHIQFFGPESLRAALSAEGLHEERSFPVGPLRTPTRGGGPLKELRRGVSRSLPRLLGCATLLVLARRATA